MEEFDYNRVCRIINFILRQPYLTDDDRDEIKQEAAIAAVKHGFEPSTRIWYAAVDTARRIRRRRVHSPIKNEVPYNQNIEGLIATDELLSKVSIKERFAIEGCLRGYSQAELGKMINRDDTQISRYRKSGLKKLKQQL